MTEQEYAEHQACVDWLDEMRALMAKGREVQNGHARVETKAFADECREMWHEAQNNIAHLLALDAQGVPGMLELSVTYSNMADCLRELV